MPYNDTQRAEIIKRKLAEQTPTQTTLKLLLPEMPVSIVDERNDDQRFMVVDVLTQQEAQLINTIRGYIKSLDEVSEAGSAMKAERCKVVFEQLMNRK